MSAATNDITTENPDASLLNLLEKVANHWSASALLDEEAMNARRRGNITDADELAVRSEKMCTDAVALEWECLITKKPATRAGYDALVRMVQTSERDPEDLIRIGWYLGHAAGTLGLSVTMPRLTPPEVPRRMANAG